MLSAVRCASELQRNEERRNGPNRRCWPCQVTAELLCKRINEARAQPLTGDRIEVTRYPAAFVSNRN